MKIRKIKETDLAVRVSWMNDLRIYSRMGLRFPISLVETKEWYYRVSINPDRIDFVFEDHKDQLSAMAGITNINQDIGCGEVYIFVNPYRLGEGIGKKAILLLCQYAYNKLYLSSLYLFVSIDNIRAKNLYEKIGFVKKQIPLQYVEYCNAHNKEYYECRDSDFLYS